MAGAGPVRPITDSAAAVRVSAVTDRLHKGDSSWPGGGFPRRAVPLRDPATYLGGASVMTRSVVSRQDFSAAAFSIGDMSNTLITWLILPSVTVRYSVPCRFRTNGRSTA